MKKCKRKLIAVVAAMLSAVMLMSGCGDKKNEPASNEVTWYMPKAIENVRDQSLVENEVNRLINEKIGVNLKFKLIDAASYDQKMNVIVASGENYDICFTTSWTNSYFKNVNQNAFLELSELLEKYGQDILKKSDKRVMDAMTQNGKIYAIPSQNPLASASGRALKKDLVEKYGLDYKNAVEFKDLEPWLQKIKENEPGTIPILQIPAKVSTRYADDSIPGLRYDEQEGKFVKQFEIEEMLNNYRTIHEFYKKGYFAKDAATRTDYMAEAKSGKFAVMTTPVYTEDGSKSSANYGFECVDTYLGHTIITTPMVMTAMNAIGINSKNPENAMKLLNLIWGDPQISNTLAYGIEGVHYQVDKDNTEKFSIIPKSGKEQTWAIWHNWLGPLWDQWDSPWNRTEALKEMQEDNEKGSISGIFGFAFDSDPVKTEYAQVSAALGEFKNILGTGSMPDFDAYMAKVNTKLEAAGIDRLLEEANRQLEEWKKTR